MLKSTGVLVCASRCLKVLGGAGSVKKRMWFIDIWNCRDARIRLATLEFRFQKLDLD